MARGDNLTKEDRKRGGANSHGGGRKKNPQSQPMEDMGILDESM